MLPGRFFGTDQYSVWATDSNGNYMSNIIGTASGTNSTLESIETSFHQDLNGDGVIGLPPLPTTLIESFGSTSLNEIGNHFYLYDGTGVGPSLKYHGADVVEGQWGASVVPIGAEVTATGYDVAWKVLWHRPVFGVGDRQQRQLHVEYYWYCVGNEFDAGIDRDQFPSGPQRR